ncbi:hypothetical protein M758_3G133300 [Ceratodon purpureus]|nr:hypothetical protein M758_3G133300 [Ceratodon purpureus]
MVRWSNSQFFLPGLWCFFKLLWLCLVWGVWDPGLCWSEDRGEEFRRL